MTYPYHQERNRGPWISTVGLIVALGIFCLPWLTRQVTTQWPTWAAPSQPQEQLYDKALQVGWETAVATQAAQTHQDWKAISQQWTVAIDMLKTLQQERGHPEATVAIKLEEYQHNRRYAEQQAAQVLPNYRWQALSTVPGETTYLLVSPATADTPLPGPPLKIGADDSIQNLPVVNAVLASLDLPPISPSTGTTASSRQALSNQYIVKDYGLGELVLFQFLCSDSPKVGSQYACFREISVRYR